MQVMGMGGAPRWLEISEATQYARLGRTKLMRLIADGEIRATKRPVGGWIVDRISIDEYNSGGHQEALLMADIAERIGL